MIKHKERMITTSVSITLGSEAGKRVVEVTNLNKGYAYIYFDTLDEADSFFEAFTKEKADELKFSFDKVKFFKPVMILNPRFDEEFDTI